MDALLRWLLGIPALVILLLCVPVSARSQALWKETEVGKSLEATQRQFPKAVHPSTPTQLGDGSRELLRLPNTIVQNHTFDALFFFKQGKLTQISLELQEQGGAVFALQTFLDIKSAFDAKYGAPDEEEDQQFNAPTGPAAFRSASWRSRRTLITLSYATAAGRLVVLNVAYRLATDKNNDDI